MLDRSPTRLGALIVCGAIAALAAPAFAADGPPSNSVPGNTARLDVATHPTAAAPGGPITSAPAPAGARAVSPTIVGALQARAHMPPGAPVPPTLELEVLDPNVDPNGRPAVIPVVGPDGVARVDIPPTVLVHRFYYTGDRSFQGPMLPGGPTIVVVNHPADGERLYLEIQMPPGAPRVIYTRHSIEYNYGLQSVTLSFGHHGRPKITFRQGVPLTTKVKVVGTQATQAAGRWIKRTGLPETGRQIHQETVNIIETSADRVHDVGKAILNPLSQIVKLIPGINMLTSSPDQRMQKERDSGVQQAASVATPFEESVPTVR